MHGVRHHDHGWFLFLEQQIDTCIDLVGIEVVLIIADRDDIARAAAILEKQQHAVVQDIRRTVLGNRIIDTLFGGAVGHRKIDGDGWRWLRRCWCWCRCPRSFGWRSRGFPSWRVAGRRSSSSRRRRSSSY